MVDIHAYTVESDKAVSQSAREKLPGTDYLCFSSAGGVEEFFAIQGAVPSGAKCVCIGETTAKALREHYNLPFLCSREISAEGMVKAILRSQQPEENAV